MLEKWAVMRRELRLGAISCGGPPASGFSTLDASSSECSVRATRRASLCSVGACSARRFCPAGGVIRTTIAGMLSLPVFSISRFCCCWLWVSGALNPAAFKCCSTSLLKAKARMVKMPTAARTFFGCFQVRSAIRVTTRSSIFGAGAPNSDLCHLSLLLVELDDANRAVGCRINAEIAEDALVEVLLDHLDLAAGVLEDVNGADFLELGGEGGVAGYGGVDLDVDEDLVHLLGHQAATSSFCLIASGISSIRSTTLIPAASRRAIFSVAVASAPPPMVPACPKLIPFISSSSMNLPAMKATIGRRLSLSETHSESWASMRPPGSV